MIISGGNGSSGVSTGRYGDITNVGSQYIDANGTQIRLDSCHAFTYDTDKNTIRFGYFRINSSDLFDCIRANPLSSYPDGKYTFKYVIGYESYFGSNYGEGSFDITKTNGSIVSSTIELSYCYDNYSYSSLRTIYLLGVTFSL